MREKKSCERDRGVKKVEMIFCRNNQNPSINHLRSKEMESDMTHAIYY